MVTCNVRKGQNLELAQSFPYCSWKTQTTDLNVPLCSYVSHENCRIAPPPYWLKSMYYNKEQKATKTRSPAWKWTVILKEDQNG